eukprot:ANDGO_03361.mRNA.1 hypothetical protein
MVQRSGLLFFHGAFVGERAEVPSDNAFAIPLTNAVKLVPEKVTVSVTYTDDAVHSCIRTVFRIPTAPAVLSDAKSLLFVFDGSLIPKYEAMSFCGEIENPTHLTKKEKEKEKENNNGRDDEAADRVGDAHVRRHVKWFGLRGEWIDRREWTDSPYAEIMFPDVLEALREERPLVKTDAPQNDALNALSNAVYVGCVPMSAAVRDQLLQSDGNFAFIVKYRSKPRKLKPTSTSGCSYLSWSFPLRACLDIPAEFVCQVSTARAISQIASSTHPSALHPLVTGNKALFRLSKQTIAHSTGFFKQKVSKVNIAVNFGTPLNASIAEWFPMLLAIAFLACLVWALHTRLVEGSHPSPRRSFARSGLDGFDVGDDDLHEL